MAAMTQVPAARTLASLLQRSSPGFQDVAITGIALDSRKVQPGDVFLALSGEVHDGRQFIEQAVANGAAAVIAEAPVAGFVDALPVPLVEVPELALEAGFIAARFYDHPSRALYMVGVTGTNGKTTTTSLIAQLSRLSGSSCGVIGTLGASLDGAPTESLNTTPDAVSLQAQLAQWQAQDVAAVAMEVSSHALVQGRVNGVEFDTAVFTNLSQDHLDYHGSLDAYGQAKLRLFSAPHLKNALINLDDEFVAGAVAAIPPSVRVLSYSALGNPAADIAFEQVSFHQYGVNATLRTPWGRGDCVSPLQGVFNLSNLAAALAVQLLRGAEIKQLLVKVSGLTSVAGRMQSIPNTLGITAIVDYAHTPDALQQVLVALRPHVGGRLITVFGCGGDRDRSKRPIMGRFASELSDLVIVTSDNPRTENAAAILRDIASGCTGNYQLCEDRGEAIAQAVAGAVAGDCILVAGKGHEAYQIVENQRLPFSDEQQVRLALAARQQS